MRPILIRAFGEDVSNETIDHLEAGLTTERFRQNQIVYHQGADPDGIFVVCHGCILLEWSAPNGFIAAFRLASPGACFGHRSFCADEPRSTVARALSPVLTLHLSRPLLEAVAASNPLIYRALARLNARDAGPRISKVARNGRTPARTRLAYVLSELTEGLQGRSSEDGEVFEFPLTQKDLSNLLDVSHETISRCLHEFQLEGLLMIEHGPRRLLISDRSELARLAGSSE